MRDVVPMRIGLLDAMGGGNLGDAAIQDSVIANIRSRLPQARIVGFSFVPDDTAQRHGIPSYPITRHYRSPAPPATQASDRKIVKSRLKSALRRVPVVYASARLVVNVARETVFLARTFKALRSLDVLIMSGGGQLCELWGGPWAHLFNLFKFSLLARLARKRLYFLDVGVEPLEHRLSRFFARSAVRLADYVSFRDAHSQRLARDMGIKIKTWVCADPAYALDLNCYRNATAPCATVPTVGINPVGYCDPRIWPRKEQPIYAAYLDKLAAFALWLLEQGYSVRLFTTSPGVDKHAIADLKRRVLEAPGRSASGRAGGTVTEALCESVRDVVKQMSGCDYIVASRYHGVIFSHLLRKPVIALSYQAKSDVAMQPMGLGEFSANIEYFETDWLISAFRSLVRSGDGIRSHESHAVTAYADLLRGQFDALFSPAATAVRTAPAELAATSCSK